MKQRDIKLLWGRAASRCAICKNELTQDSKASKAFLIGEHCHIVGETEDSPRGDSPLTVEERDSYHNHILLCPTDHSSVDKNVEDWPVESLHLAKSEHELWVKENLSESGDTQLAADQSAISSLVDNVVEACNLEYWNDWVARSYGLDGRIPMGMLDGTYDFRLRVAAAIVPAEFEEVGRSAATVSILLLEFYDTFMENAELREGHYRAEKTAARAGTTAGPAGRIAAAGEFGRPGRRSRARFQ